MFKFLYFLVTISVILSFTKEAEAQILTDTRNQIYVGFISTGSDFVIDDDNTYGLNLQYGRDFKYFKGGRFVIGGKVSYSNMQGIANTKMGLTLRTQKKLFFDMDVLVGMSSIHNKEILESLETNYPDKKHHAPILGTALGIGYRFPYSRWLIHSAYNINTALDHENFGNFRGGFMIQLGYRF